MLKVINLFVIDQIFASASHRISAMAKMVYINCLMHHFRALPATPASAVAFELFEIDFPGESFKKFLNYLRELEKSELISIGAYSITFHNAWGKHINRELLEKTSPEQYVGAFNFKTAEQFRAELIGRDSLYELLALKHKIKKAKAVEMISLFIKEQETAEKKYASFSECLRHCMFWIPKNMDNKVFNTSKTGKILG